MSIDIDKMENYPTTKRNNLPIYATTWISKILCWEKEGRHKRAHTIWLQTDKSMMIEIRKVYIVGGEKG